MPKKKNKKKSSDSPAGGEGDGGEEEVDAGGADDVNDSFEDPAVDTSEEVSDPTTPAPPPEEPSLPIDTTPSPVEATPPPVDKPAIQSRVAPKTPMTPASATPKKLPTPSTGNANRGFSAPGRGSNKVWEEIATVTTDKVNALMLSASAHKWEVVVTIHEPGKPLLSTLSSRVPPKQARLVMTEMRTRMRTSVNGDEAPTLDAVLLAGMRELAALEEEDMADLADPPSSLASKEAVVEVVCHTEFKTQVTYRLKGALSDLQAIALCSAMRRLNNLQKSAVSPHDPVSSTLAAAVIAGLLTWDRDL